MEKQVSLGIIFFIGSRLKTTSRIAVHSVACWVLRRARQRTVCLHRGARAAFYCAIPLYINC